MYNDKPEQQGIRCIQDILMASGQQHTFDIFNVRAKYELPDLSYDLYVSSGGPGNPLEYNKNWSDQYSCLIRSIFDWNFTHPDHPKFLFAICHSFQILCSLQGIGTINKRESFTFGVTKVIKTAEGRKDDLLQNLNDTFYAADHRYFQVLNPDHAKIDQLGAKILGFEERTGEDAYQKSIMMVRFSPEIVGTQFHPEADVKGMELILDNPVLQNEIERVLGKGQIAKIRKDIENPDNVEKMYCTLLPEFIDYAGEKLSLAIESEPVNLL